MENMIYNLFTFGVAICTENAEFVRVKHCINEWEETPEKKKNTNEI